MPIMKFSAHVNSVFADSDVTYDIVKNLMYDLARGNEIYDEESGRVVSKAEAEAKLHDITLKIFGLTKDATPRDRSRAMRDHGRDFFDVIEEVIDDVIAEGFRNNQWFRELVDYRNIAMGDSLNFVSEDNSVLIVGKVGNSHHDIILQTLGENEVYRVPTARYAVAVGADIDRYLLGQVDWAKLVSKVADAFEIYIQELAYATINSAVAALPAAFKNSGSLTKAGFDAILDNVEAAANGADIVIMGTRAALRSLSGIADVNYIADSQKESVASTGLIGYYDGNLLVRVPQRFKDKTLSAKVFDDKLLFVLPAVNGKLIDFVDEGETEINEVTDKGEVNGRIDDIRKYEAQRVFGVAIKTNCYFGAWTLP